ncbi:hypothetical protein ACW2QC_16765 [Virgibacillus sp. FSP13]
MGKLKIDNLTKSYNQNVILNDVSFTVHEGEFVSRLGPSGSGIYT